MAEARKHVPRATKKQIKNKTVAVVRTTSPRMQLWMSGKLDPEDLTDEEVNKMQLMDSDGHFRGRPPGMVPRELMLAFRTEQQKRLQSWFAEQVPLAQTAVKELLASKHLSPGDATRLRAAEGVFERVIGKVGQETHVIVDKGRSFEDVTADVVMDLDMGEIEGEVL
jgi:hypothetical protein